MNHSSPLDQLLEFIFIYSVGRNPRPDLFWQAIAVLVRSNFMKLYKQDAFSAFYMQKLGLLILEDPGFSKLDTKNYEKLVALIPLSAKRLLNVDVTITEATVVPYDVLFDKIIPNHGQQILPQLLQHFEQVCHEESVTTIKEAMAWFSKNPDLKREFYPGLTHRISGPDMAAPRFLEIIRKIKDRDCSLRGVIDCLQTTEEDIDQLARLLTKVYFERRDKILAGVDIRQLPKYSISQIGFLLQGTYFAHDEKAYLLLINCPIIEDTAVVDTIHAFARGGILVGSTPAQESYCLVSLFPFLSDAEMISKERGQITNLEEAISYYVVHELGHLFLKLPDTYIHDGCVMNPMKSFKLQDWYENIRLCELCLGAK